MRLWALNVQCNAFVTTLSSNNYLVLSVGSTLYFFTTNTKSSLLTAALNMGYRRGADSESV